jgi:hypothetical protein
LILCEPVDIGIAAGTELLLGMSALRSLEPVR